MNPVLEALPSVLGAAAVLPALIYLLSLTMLDERPERPLVVVGCFFLGAVGVLLLDHMRLPVGLFTPPARFGLSGTLYQTWIETAIPEETVKLAILLAFAQRYLRLGHPMEGIIYGAAVGLGFAAYENLMLVVHLPDEWSDHFVIRSILTVPVHGALGVVSGLYVARTRFGGALAGAQSARAYRWNSYLLAWLLPTLLHGLYNLPLLLVRNTMGIHSPHAAPLQTLGFLVGTGIVLGATRVLYIVTLAQTGVKPSAHPARRRFRYWRLHVIAGFTGLLGALMVLLEVQASLRHDAFAFDRHVLLIIGAALVVVGAQVHRRAEKVTNGSTKSAGIP